MSIGPNGKGKLTAKKLETMKRMYMEYKPISQIAKAFGVQRSTVNWHINTNAWSAERKLQESEVFSSFDDSKKVDFVNMTKHSVAIMTRSLEALATRHEPPTINEATRAADILKTLDNILRLDEGKPTDIVESTEKAMDGKELKKKLALDPFSNIESDEENDEKKIN